MSPLGDTPPPQPQLARTQHRASGQEMICGIARGMVFWGAVEEKESKGTEHFHPKDDPCPWIVLSTPRVHSQLPIVVAAPLTSNLDKDQLANFRLYRIRIPEVHLTKYALPFGAKSLKGDSLVLTEQIRVMAHARLLDNPIARASLQVLASIEAGLKFVLDLG